MTTRKLFRRILVAATVVAALPTAWTLPVHGQGGPQGSPQMLPGGSMQQQEVQGTVKNLDPSRGMLTLEDGTQLTIPPTVQLPGGIKEGAIVKANFEERSGQNVVTSLEVQQP
jgi:hypothetical protein